MDRAYAEPLDVRTVAAVAHVSEAHFIRSFRAVFGETPHRYLQRRRVERSMFLLRETDRSITDICFDVGFMSLGTFSRTFRDIIGETPSSYRDGHGPMVPPNRVPGQADVEINLEQPGPPLHDEATTEQLRELIAKGALSGLVFHTDDVRALYETLQARGVTDFTQEPIDHFYGTDMGLRDPFGNAIRVLERKTAV